MSGHGCVKLGVSVNCMECIYSIGKLEAWLVRVYREGITLGHMKAMKQDT